MATAVRILKDEFVEMLRKCVDEQMAENESPLRIFNLEDSFDMAIKRVFREIRNKYLVEIAYDSPMGEESVWITGGGAGRIVHTVWCGVRGCRGTTTVWVKNTEFRSLQDFEYFMKKLRDPRGNEYVDGYSEFRIVNGEFKN